MGRLGFQRARKHERKAMAFRASFSTDKERALSSSLKNREILTFLPQKNFSFLFVPFLFSIVISISVVILFVLVSFGGILLFFFFFLVCFTFIFVRRSKFRD